MLAEREGFEPPDLLGSTVFKTAALNRSAIAPGRFYQFEYSVPSVDLPADEDFTWPTKPGSTL